MARKRATPTKIARAKAHRAEYERKLEAFLARNDGESFTFAKIKGGYYSDRNAAGLAMQAEERGMTVTAFGAYDDWQAAGRQVRPGEQAFRVLTPAGEYATRSGASADQVTDGTDPAELDGGATRTRKFFRLGPTFAYEQTDAIADLDPEPARRSDEELEELEHQEIEELASTPPITFRSVWPPSGEGVA
jgi:N-terminal domain of anti-restriction factor ArdC